MLDVIITSTCRKTIVPTLKSFHKHVSYRGEFRFIVNIDVKFPGYLAALKSFLKSMGIRDISINLCPKAWPDGLTEATNYLYSKIESKYYFNLQDDWIFLKGFDMNCLIDLMNRREDIQHIRLSKQRIQDVAWLYHISNENIPEFHKRKKNVTVDGINLVQTHTWSFNPSLSRTSVAKKIIPVPANTRAETYFCHKIDEMFEYPVTYILGQIGDKPMIRDIGRNKVIEFLRSVKKQVLKKSKKFGKVPSF